MQANFGVTKERRMLGLAGMLVHDDSVDDVGVVLFEAFDHSLMGLH